MGANQTKQTSIINTVNNIVNKTVNETINNFKTSATVDQKMIINCTPEQMVLAIQDKELQFRIYDSMYKTWANMTDKNGIYPPEKPSEFLCTAKNIEQKSIINLKVDTKSKTEMQNQIESKLKNEAKQYDYLDKMKDLVGLSNTEKETIIKMTNNIKNENFSKTLNETINAATTNQTLEFSGVSTSNVNQNAVVDMVSSSILDTILKNINLNDISTKNDQKSDLKESSGQTNVANNIINTVGDVFKMAIGSWIFILIAIIALFVFFPGLFCMIPPLRIPLSVAGLCSSKKKS